MHINITHSQTRILGENCVDQHQRDPYLRHVIIQEGTYVHDLLLVKSSAEKRERELKVEMAPTCSKFLASMIMAPLFPLTLIADDRIIVAAPVLLILSCFSLQYSL
jgi:hypothetical protein